MRTPIYLIIVPFLIFGFQISVYGQQVSITDILKSPSNLQFGEQINVNFNYQFRDREGVRIFIRPFTSGNLTPNFAASGSPVYRGSGRGTASFTIRSGNVKVDQIRVQVLKAAQNELLFEFFVPVEFTFSTQSLTLVQHQLTLNPGVFQIQPGNLQTITPADTVDNKNEVIEKKVTPEGVIELYYSDGTVIGIISSEERYVINPSTGDTTYTRLMFINVPGADQPAAPPGFSVTTTTDLEDDWLVSLNNWVQYLGSRLLNRIDLYLKDDAFENYMTFEQNNSTTIYEKVNLRYTFLEKLLMTGTF